MELNLLAEFAAFACMMTLSVLIGLYYGFVERKQNTVDDYLLGGKHMSVFPITMSLIASHVSGVTLLGVPSEVYVYGAQYLIIGVINIFIIIIVIYIYLPVFYDLQLTSVYEYLELRFNSTIRRICSLIYAISLILYIPIVIYVPALAFNQISSLGVHFITPIICIVCIFYTTIGGLKAVVWTDALQSFFTTVSMAIVIVLGFIQVGGLSKMIKANIEGNRLELFKMDPDPFLRNSFWTISVGLSISWITSQAIHPGSVQRFVALPSYNKARKTLIYFILGLGVVKILTGLIGIQIYTKYKDCDPVTAGYIKDNKNLLPYFVMDVASKIPGLTGLFISGIVSAALSTMSAQLNTVSGTIYEDFIVKMMGFEITQSTASIIMKVIVVIVGIICVALVSVVEKLGGILQGALCGMVASLAVTSWIVYGAQIAITNKNIQFTTRAVSVSGCPANITIHNSTDYTGLYRMNDDVYVSPDVPKIYTLCYNHYSTLGMLIGLAVGLAVSLIFPTEQDYDPKLLTPCIRNFVFTKYTAHTKKPEDGEPTAEEYALVQDTQL
ncbi:sodium-coupled monocarboxylate transporter 1-like [Adelges cooleyi]|uniref:sodium-coupled monocarboxylate transporter 1-like n=1 Tax=Adelges cooleyi TaxID=133065 RepID=UPI0021801C20|nr:sodium-coupled monocarboxylate transporter 1-like [Adelges cooleyi]